MGEPHENVWFFIRVGLAFFFFVFRVGVGVGAAIAMVGADVEPS